MMIYLASAETSEGLAGDDGQAAMRAESGQRRYTPPDGRAGILGVIYVTPGAGEALGIGEPDDGDTGPVTEACPALDALLARLAAGDDGDTSPEDKALNARDYALRQNRVLGGYAAPNGETLWGSLEFALPARTWEQWGVDFAQCPQATTIMLPSEY